MLKLLSDDDFWYCVEEYASDIAPRPVSVDSPLPNVWLGVSVEDQATADQRIPLLHVTPAALRFVSYEPALAAVDFTQWLPDRSLEIGNDRESLVALDDHVWGDCFENGDNISGAPHRPCSHRLPSPPLGALMVPGDIASDGAVQPIDDGRISVVDGHAGAHRAGMPSPVGDVSLTVDHPCDVTKDRPVVGDRDALLENAGAIAAQRMASGGESALDGAASGSEVFGDCGDSASIGVHRQRLGNGYIDSTHRLHCISWIVLGGESGPAARPFDIQWARDTIRQCRVAGVPVFVKQLGAKPVANGEYCPTELVLRDGDGWEVCLKHRAGGDMAEWPEDLRVQEWPS